MMSNCLMEKKSFFFNFIANFPSSQPGTCPIEKGFCVLPNGRDQTRGVIKLNDVDGNTEQAQATCLDLCKIRADATGCEVIWWNGNRGCYVHTQPVAKGSGFRNHMCWIFSKCKPGINVLSSDNID